MNWEKRGKSDYYYRKYRIGNSVVSEYIGNGNIADIHAEEDKVLRSVYKLQKFNKRLQKQRERDLDRKMDKVYKQITSLVNALMLTSGYHTHKGQWRKSHG